MNIEEQERQEGERLVKQILEGGETWKGIILRHEINFSVVEDTVFGGTITINRPRRFIDGQSVGYLDASGWTTGSETCTAKEATIFTSRYLRMMDMALECLNQFNNLIEGWSADEAGSRVFTNARAWEYERARDLREQSQKMKNG